MSLIVDITRRLGSFTLDAQFEAENGVTCLLGASGCGKSFTLKCIAGIERPDRGHIELDGAVLFDSEKHINLPPQKRQVGYLFQNYALFPNMNVFDNVAFGLVEKRLGKAEIREKVDAMLQLVQLGKMGKRKPNQLSGGQKQRVAIARALANDPKLLLLDEPLGALDLQLRRQMQIELKRLQKQLGITFIYITHDQEEALNMSDRIAVMKNGVFQQIGSPAEIYDRPKNAYVARFVGSANILKGTAETRDGRLCLSSGGVVCPVTCYGAEPRAGEALTVAVRSEYIDFLPEGAEGFPATVKEKSFAGGMLRLALERPGGEEIVASRHGIDSDLMPGESVRFTFAPEHAVVVEAGDET